MNLILTWNCCTPCCNWIEWYN